jgi:hypothetical protein
MLNKCTKVPQHIPSSVAEPQPVEPHHFAGAGARPKHFWLRRRVCKFIKKCYKNPKFFKLKFEVEFKNHNFVAIYLKAPFDDHLCLKKT